jgi:hypothetical protein
MLKSTDKFVCSLLVLVSVMPVAMSQSGAARSVMPVQPVADAMAFAGMAVKPEQIEFLSGASRTSEGAKVRLVSVTHGTPGMVKVKLRCENNHECLPFYVLVDGVDATEPNSLGARPAPPSKATSLPNLVRAGDHATLVLETPDARMSFPVICLQSGARGQRIRLASPDRRRTYDGEVVAAGMLKGNF